MPNPRSQRRPALVAIVALVALVALATGSADAATLEKTLERTYPLPAGGEVSVENVNGAVVVDTWDRPEVRVRATKKARAGSEEAAAEAMARLQVDVVESSDRLRIKTRHAGSQGGFFSWLRGQSSNASISYRLTVPRGIHLDARTVNGAITLNGVDGVVEASTTNGSIKVDGARGRLDASTTNGSIKVAMLEVSADAELDFSTTNGSVTIALPADVQTDLRLRTTNGGITVDLPLDEVAERSRRRLDATLNGGGGSLRVVTTNGGIRIVEN
jgi:hypothetical protein